jgi:ribonucleoside-diphosphate reductase beta chain
MLLTTKKLFNQEGQDAPSEKRIVGGNPTNIFNFENIRHPWAITLYEKMEANIWIPKKIPMGEDKLCYKTLADFEKNSYDKYLSFLVFLDSIQELNVPAISNYITCTEINHLLASQTYQESNHSSAYKYIIESVIDADLRNKIYEYWRECPELLERNKAISDSFDAFRFNPTTETFRDAILCTYILEGIFFYVSFNFFYLLESQHKMINTANQIRYIQRDEMLHCVIFENLIRGIKEEGSLDFNEEVVNRLFDEAVKAEIKWNVYLFNDDFLGFNPDSIETYIKYMANKRLQRIGFKPLYDDPKFSVNPFLHLEKMGYTETEGIEKSNFFEKTVTEYSLSSVYSTDEWDEI